MLKALVEYLKMDNHLHFLIEQWQASPQEFVEQKFNILALSCFNEDRKDVVSILFLSFIAH
jgi:hypothetical protein